MLLDELLENIGTGVTVTTTTPEEIEVTVADLELTELVPGGDEETTPGLEFIAETPAREEEVLDVTEML